MKRFLRLLAVALLLTCSLRAEEALKPKTIAGFGSSVCNGTGGGDDSYIRRLQRRMGQDGWTVLNVSRGGDNTLKIQERWAPKLDENGKQLPGQSGRFLLPQNPSYVLIGLSLGNEGFRDEQFCRNLPLLIETCRSNGMKVVVGNCYAHGNMTEANAAKSRQVNLFIGQLDVPSINFLGSVDNGEGRWEDGLWNDPGHPNEIGHGEMFYAIVPTVWRALEQGKPLPVRDSSGCLDLAGRYAEFVPGDPIHAFAEVFRVKSSAKGQIASIEVEPIAVEDAAIESNEPREKVDRKYIPSGEMEVASLSVQNGELIYNGLSTNCISSELSNGWNTVAVSHWYARGETELYVNGVKVGSVRERYTPSRFTIGGAEFSEWFIYRSALNSGEVSLLNEGGMYQSSLEIYAPLGRDGGLVSRAQSLSEISSE